MCRGVFARVSDHIRKVHAKDFSTEELIRIQKEEATRCRLAGEASFCLLDLKESCPENYLAFALKMIDAKIPVYIRETDVSVRHVTREEVLQWEANPDSRPPELKGQQRSPTRPRAKVRLQTATATRPGTSSAPPAEPDESHELEGQQREPARPRAKVRLQTATATRPGTLSAPLAEPDESHDEQALSEVDMPEEGMSPSTPVDLPEESEPEAGPSGVADSESEEEAGPSGLAHFSPLRASPDPQVSSPASSDSEALGTRAKRARVVPSDTESENSDAPDLADLETASVHSSASEDSANGQGSRATGSTKASVMQKYIEHGMHISPLERDAALKTNRVLKCIKEHYDSMKSATGNKETVKDTVTNNLSIACKIMKFCAPGNKLEYFRWDQLTASNLDRMNTLLRDEIELSPNTISNYFKVIRHMYFAILKDQEYFMKHLNAGLIRDTLMGRMNELSKANARHIARDKAAKLSKDVYLDVKQYQDIYVRVFEVFEKAKVDVKKLLEESKTRALDKNEVTVVNGFFNMQSLTCGNRPKVFQCMKKEVYKMAKKTPKIDANGNTYYFLATAEHKTGGQFVAFIYLTEELMEMLNLYYKNVRPTPVSGHKDYLFINTNGKKIHNPSNDLDRFINKYDKTLSVNHTDFRKIVTTLSRNYMQGDQQRILHGMLKHSEATANRHYLLGNDDAVSHKLGIPLLGNLLNICSADVGRPVESYINASTGLNADVSEPTKQALLKLYQNLDRSLPEVPLPTPMESGAAAKEPAVPPSPVPSDNSESSFTSSDPTKSMTDADLIRTKAGIVTVDTVTPSRNEFEKHINDLGLSSRTRSEKDVLFKSLCSYVQYQRNKCRAEQTVEALRRLQEPSKLEESIDKHLTEKGWKNIKTAKEALDKLNKIHKGKALTRKATVTPAKKTPPLDSKLKEQIQSQSWPLILIKKCKGDKGYGAYASKNIPKGTIICDYHGEIISKSDGDYRYNELYKDRTDNVFMFQFGFKGQQYYCDAVKPCECHPNKKIKGRYLNHSRKNPNVNVVARGDGDQVVLLMTTTRDVPLGTELLFNYGCKTDSGSHQEESM